MKLLRGRARGLVRAFDRDPIPMWVVRDGDVPVFVGLPHHYLVRVSDPRASLAALVGAAQVKTKVHEVS